MNREIKFRAWVLNECFDFKTDKKKTEGDWISKWVMGEVKCLYTSKNRVRVIDGGISNYHDYNIGEKCFLMQYTGLKDKNGKEIYEGDIVKWGHLKNSRESEIRIAAVMFNPDLQFDCKNITYPHVFHWGRFAYDSNQLEVIGNIYETPELLNKNQEVKECDATQDDSSKTA